MAILAMQILQMDNSRMALNYAVSSIEHLRSPLLKRTIDPQDMQYSGNLCYFAGIMAL